MWQKQNILIHRTNASNSLWCIKPHIIPLAHVRIIIINVLRMYLVIVCVRLIVENVYVCLYINKFNRLVHQVPTLFLFFLFLILSSVSFRHFSFLFFVQFCFMRSFNFIILLNFVYSFHFDFYTPMVWHI